MNQNLQAFFRQRIPLALFLVGYLLFAGFRHKDYGIGWDEYIVYMGGYWLYQDVTGHPQAILHEDSAAPGSPHYDHVYPMALYALNQKLTISGFHLSNLLFAGTILIVGFEAVLPFCANPWWALLGPLFLILNPRFFGEWSNNPKDMPFAVLYFISLWLIYYWRRSEKFILLITLGLVIGAATGVRLLGLSLIAIYVLFEIYERLLENDRKAWLSLVWRTVFLSGVVLLVLLATWPFLSESPLSHGARLLELAKNFPWNMPVLFEGRTVLGTELGRSYLPVWFFISTPVFILVMALMSLWCLPKKSPQSFGAFLTGVLFFHFLIYLIIKPNVYDGVRHYLFLEPVLSILACLFLLGVFQEASKLKWVLAALVGFNALAVGSQLFQLHPYEYTYFNEMIGGLPGAAGKFETEYQGTSYKEAVEWLKENASKDTQKIYWVNAEGSAFQSAHYFSSNMRWADFAHADYFIANTRWNRQTQADPRKIIHVVEREGVPFTYVFKLH
ncbi:MAG TPA: hypothetical protein VK791_07425 [bacterium]|jgi:hypothetical protein|nr:hypothetical protein [bacterium]